MKGYGFSVKGARGPGKVVAFMGGAFVIPFRDWVKAAGRFDPTDDYSPSRAALNAAWLGEFSVVDIAVGYGPCTPDGLPVIERRNGAVVVTGGCKLGWTLGPGIAKAAANLALGRASATPLTTERLGAR